MTKQQVPQRTSLYSLIQVKAFPEAKDVREYQLHKLHDVHAWIKPPTCGEAQVLPVSILYDNSFKLQSNPDRYEWLLLGYNGGIIYWGTSHADVIKFLKHMRYQVIVEEKD